MKLDPVEGAAADYMAMNDAKVLEIQAAAKTFAVDLVKEQIAAGKPASGITKARHAAIVAKTLAEMVDSFALGGEADPSSAQVMQAALLGTSLLNASQLRQELEKAGVLKAQGVNLDEY